MGRVGQLLTSLADDSEATEGGEKQLLKSHSELWKWAQSWPVCCFVCDVLAATQRTKQTPALFYVGRRPCTWATIMGVVVSVSVYESRSVISIDDDSAVIDCINMHNQHVYFENRPYPYTPDAPEGQKPSGSRVEVGWVVSLVGRIVPYRGTVQLHIDRLDRVYDSNQEPAHWQRVIRAHQEDYQCSKSFHPIEFRRAERSAEGQTLDRPDACDPVPSSPSHVKPKPFGVFILHLACGDFSDRVLQNLLSHPGRLSSRHLTVSTFRIYIKHYMETLSPSGLRLSTFPIPSSSSQTPPASLEPQDLHNPEGFTISYLRRVPELHLLASRIIRYAYNARFKDQQSQARSTSQSCPGKSGGPSSSNGSLQGIPSIPAAHHLHRKIKTLFVRTIQELHRDGAVILTFGRCRPVPPDEHGFFPDMPNIWKETDASRADSRSHYIRDPTFPVSGDSDEELSEPDDNEDGYIPLTRELLCVKVTNTIITMHRASTQMRIKYSVPGDNPLYHGKMRPPSPGEIAIWLAREDEWRQVGELVVLDTLQHLRELDVVYKVTQGRWQIRAEYLRNQRRLDLTA